MVLICAVPPRNLYDAAQDELDDAQAAYDDLMYGDGAQKIIDARAALATAEERYQSAQRPTAGAESGINTANLAGLLNPRFAKRSWQLQQARLAVNQAEASLDLDRHPDREVDHHRPDGWGHLDLDRQSRRGDRGWVDRHACWATCPT